MPETKKRALADILEQETGVAAADLTQDVRLEEHLDDLDLIELVTEIEKDFGVSVPVGAEYEWKTVGDVYAAVRALAGVVDV